MLSATLFLLFAQGQVPPAPGSASKPAPKTAWELLASKYDANHDGKITREEYPKEDLYFLRLDLDGDGAITKIDADALGSKAPKRSGRKGKGKGKAGKPGDAIERRYITAKADEMAPDFDLPLLLSQQPKVKAAKAAASKAKDSQGVNAHSQPSTNIATEVNNLKRLKLSSFRGEKPVALIFGSYT